jgi:uncharacterized MAPEG superfamily protein
MTPPFVCVGLAFGLVLLAHLPVIVAKWKLGYDNKFPRDQAAKLSGWGARAWGAEQNAIENFAPFAAAVVIAHLSAADPQRSALLAYVFVGARTLHLATYLANLDYLRTGLWFMGMLATAGLFVLAFVAGGS